MLRKNINTGNLTDGADITISYNATDGLISTAADDVNLTDCSADASYGLITTATDDDNSTDCDDIKI